MAHRAARGDAERNGQEKTAYAAHKAIYDGIVARDADRAEAAMRDHLEQLADTFWRQRTETEDR